MSGILPLQILAKISVKIICRISHQMCFRTFKGLLKNNKG